MTPTDPIAELRAELVAAHTLALRRYIHGKDTSAHAAEMDTVGSKIAALDALLANRARLHATVGKLQEMATEKYAQARSHAFGWSTARPGQKSARLWRYARDAQEEAAALSRLAREAMGVEEAECP